MLLFPADPPRSSLAAPPGCQVESLPNLLYLRRTPKHVAAGSADGTVRFHDPRSLKQTQAISAHLGGLSGLESSGWNVLTFGYTVKCVVFALLRPTTRQTTR